MTSTDRNFEDQFNDWLDAFVSDEAPPVDQPITPMSEAAKRLHSQDDSPAPPRGLSTQIWEDLMNQTALAGTLPLPNASISYPSLNGRAGTRLPAGRRAITRDWGRTGFARWAAVALLILTLGGGYAAYGTFWSNPEKLSSVPALVAPAGTPEPTPYPRTGNPVIGVWQITLESGQPGSAVTFFIFGSDGSFSSPDIDRINVGEWRATGSRSAEFKMYLQDVSSPDFFSPDYVKEGPTPQVSFEVWDMEATVDASGNRMTLTGHFDHYAGENLVFTAKDMHSDGVRFVSAESLSTPTS